MNINPNYLIHDPEALQALYGTSSEASIVKESEFITPEYRQLIDASPFMVLATAGPDGLDASPRGERPCVVNIEDEKTLLLPDRRGNNRIDSLRNILADPRVALLFMIPGSGHTLRVNGFAMVSVDPVLTARFTVEGKAPRSVIVISVETVFFQCARAIMRAGLWDSANHVPASALPTAGDILKAQTEGRFDGGTYDQTWPARAEETML